MVNVYESVEANKRKSWLVIAGFILFVTVSVYFISQGFAAYFGYEPGGLSIAGLALIFSGITSFISYYYSDRIILTLSGARPADRKTDFHFYTVLENLSLGAGLPMPRAYIIEDTALNAFATGRDPDHAVVVATSGLLQSLSRVELEGVLGHELSHIKNYDIRLMSIVTILLGLITLMADWFLRSSFRMSGGSRSRDKEGAGAVMVILGLIFAMLSPIIAQLIQLAISRRREYAADAGSVMLTRQPSGLISALAKLGADREPLEAANKATAHLYITNPLKNHHDAVGWFSSLFNTHPSVKDRIQALQSMV